MTALAAQASRAASEPVAITVDGYAGKSITLHVPDDAVFSECDRGIFGSWGVSRSDISPFRYHQGPGQIDVVWALDLDGVLAVIDWSYYEGTPPPSADRQAWHHARHELCHRTGRLLRRLLPPLPGPRDERRQPRARRPLA
ncbi:MAG TPA: hypothetical protein VFU44_12230 [Candidatus Limnocylindria bacterium]|nr:hypothetical protein [Candidatus Limnocylindria bacterium]